MDHIYAMTSPPKIWRQILGPQKSTKLHFCVIFRPERPVSLLFQHFLCPPGLFFPHPSLSIDSVKIRISIMKISGCFVAYGMPSHTYSSAALGTGRQWIRLVVNISNFLILVISIKLMCILCLLGWHRAIYIVVGEPEDGRIMGRVIWEEVEAV